MQKMFAIKYLIESPCFVLFAHILCSGQEILKEKWINEVIFTYNCVNKFIGMNWSVIFYIYNLFFVFLLFLPSPTALSRDTSLFPPPEGSSEPVFPHFMMACLSECWHQPSGRRWRTPPSHCPGQPCSAERSPRWCPARTWPSPVWLSTPLSTSPPKNSITSSMWCKSPHYSWWWKFMSWMRIQILFHY